MALKNKPTTVILERAEDKKHSVLYKAAPGVNEPCFTNVYFNRTAYDTPPAKIRVTVEEVK